MNYCEFGLLGCVHDLVIMMRGNEILESHKEKTENGNLQPCRQVVDKLMLRNAASLKYCRQKSDAPGYKGTTLYNIH
jgi:hypothetical protein